MENSNKISMLSNNHSFFFVPFKVSDIGIWREAVEANTYLNRNGKEIPVWIKITDSIPVHLMKFVNDGVGYHTKRQYAYSLAEKRAFGIPYTDGNKKLLSSTVTRKGNKREFTYDIKNVRMHCFGTGVGFLVYDIYYSKDMTYDDILEFNYSFKKMGISKFEIKGTEMQQSDGFSFLYNLSKAMISNAGKCAVEVFFSSISKVKMQCNVFSILNWNNNNDIENQLFHLCHSYNNDYEYSAVISELDFITYHPYNYVHWGYCQDGIVCIYNDVCEFTHDVLPGNLQNDYYFMYIILLHQRYTLLKLMDEIMTCKKENSNEWKAIQNNLLDFKIEYSFNVVSDEMPYHRIYSDMRKSLSICEFENDISEVSDKMYMINREDEMNQLNKLHEEEQRAADLRSWRTDIVLGLLSLLAVFSALIDSTDVINAWYPKEGFFVVSIPHFIAYSIITLVMLIVVFFLIQSYRQYRNMKKRK